MKTPHHYMLQINFAWRLYQQKDSSMYFSNQNWIDPAGMLVKLPILLISIIMMDNGY